MPHATILLHHTLPRGTAHPRHALLPPTGTAQSLLSTMYFVVGAGMGSTMWGAVYQSYGAATTYLLGLIALLLSAGLVAAGHRPQLHTNGEKLKPECPV